MPSKKTFTDNQYQGTTLCDTPREFSYDYIRAIDGVIETMTERHSKVLVARLDLRFPKDHNADKSNRDFSKTMQAVCQEFSRKGLYLMSRLHDLRPIWRSLDQDYVDKLMKLSLMLILLLSDRRIEENC